MSTQISILGGSVASPSRDHDTELFQYMRVSHLSEDEKQKLIGRLEGESQTIRFEFAELVHTTETELCQKNISPKTLIQKFTYFNASLIEEFGEAKSIEEVFAVANHYWSFYNYDPLQYIIKVFSLRTEAMDQYIQNFRKYAERRLCECKNDIAGSHDECGRRVVMKIDDNMNVQWTTLEDVRRLQDQACKITGVDIKQLVRVEGGCLYFIYRLPHKDISAIDSLTEVQKQELRDIGVLSIACETKIVTWQMDAKKFKRSIVTNRASIFSEEFSLTEFSEYKTNLALTVGVFNDHVGLKVDITALAPENVINSNMLVATVIPSVHYNSQSHTQWLTKTQMPLNSFQLEKIMSSHDVLAADADLFEFYMEFYITQRKRKRASFDSVSLMQETYLTLPKKRSLPPIEYQHCLS